MTAATQSAHLHRMLEVREEPMTRTIPIITPPTIKMSAPSPGDPMEVTTPTNSPPRPQKMSSTSQQQQQQHGEGKDYRENNSSGGPVTPSAGTSQTSGPHSSASPPDSADPAPKSEATGSLLSASSSLGTGVGMVQAPVAAAPAIHQPKIVQTAFIHKLYNMLEDPNIQHLISWSSSAESFVMSPSHDFSKVLAQYFKHTNISSFVRQLNMYGFHKVSDVFANGSDSTTLWEFKHGNGNFKRGDLIGLREIKRRASRHSLVHRDYNPQKPPAPTQHGAPAEAMPVPDNSDPMRVTTIDQAMYSFDARLQRHEEAIHMMHVRHQSAMEAISRLLQFNQEATRIIKHLVPNQDSPIYREVLNMQSEIQRQVEMASRGFDDAHDPLPYTSTRQYFANVETAPVSPRQMAQDDPRRQTLNVPQPAPPPRANLYRPPVPSNLSVSTRRPYGSIGGTAQASPSSLRPHPPPLPPPQHPQHLQPPQHSQPSLHPQHPLANLDPSSNNMGRRHTSADIRAQGWQPTNPPQFPPSGPPHASHFPPSPSRLVPEEQRIRESFSAYSFPQASQPHSRPSTPPPPVPPFTGTSNGNNSNAGNGNNGGNNGGNNDMGNWSWTAVNRSNNSLNVKDSSGPPTRRGSMAHILNPTDTAERDEEEGSLREDDRKRKRLL